MENQNKTMLTDLYQLTMNAAYFDNKKGDDIATFDLFIRKLPQDWGYFIANGIEDAIDYVTNIKFEEKGIDYLKKQGTFPDAFLNSLKDFKFEGEIYAVKEGTPIFPEEPIMRVTAKRSQAQFIETALLNMINFQTLIATKASRVVNATKPFNWLPNPPWSMSHAPIREGDVVDYGLRRAQEEDAAMKGARAAYIGGAIATSNVKAGMEYGLPIRGTHAHSFVMSFPTELDAFRAYAKTFPNKPTLLIDTYNTIEGAKNAMTVAKELEAQGKRLGAVRLDSGDLADLSKKVRQMLDDNGLDYVKILASNDLNEYKIVELLKKGAQIDAYGVGTEMITAKPIAAIGGVYKLVEDGDGPKIKLSEGKRTLPGKKQVYRQKVPIGETYYYDVIALDGEDIPVDEGGVPGKKLLEAVVKDGVRVREKPTLEQTRDYCLQEVNKLWQCFREVKVDRGYEVRISQKLNDLVQKLTEKYGGK